MILVLNRSQSLFYCRASIDAVIEEFNEKGLKFTMDDIAKILGISKRTLYTVVQDKEALFIEAVDHVVGAIKERYLESEFNSFFLLLS